MEVTTLLVINTVIITLLIFIYSYKVITDHIKNKRIKEKIEDLQSELDHITTTNKLQHDSRIEFANKIITKIDTNESLIKKSIENQDYIFKLFRKEETHAKNY